MTRTEFAKLAWCAGDVTSLDEWNNDWGDEAAVKFLEQNGKALQDRLCQVGFEVMGDLLSGWSPEDSDE